LLISAPQEGILESSKSVLSISLSIKGPAIPVENDYSEESLSNISRYISADFTRQTTKSNVKDTENKMAVMQKQSIKTIAAIFNLNNCF
jgi:hypothetical protein